MDIQKILKQLLERRPVFHSEADFQHEFAWEIRQQVPTVEIRLERPFGDGQSVDIWLKENGQEIVIELKYSTKPASLLVNGESYVLSGDGSTKAKYDFWRDIERLQASFVEKGVKACAIFLTNNPFNWDSVCIDPDFSIHAGRGQVSGQLICRRKPCPKYLSAPVDLGRYQYNLGADCWQTHEFYDDNKKNSFFRFLVLEVGKR